MKRVTMPIVRVDKVIKAISEMPRYHITLLMLTIAICCYFIAG